jgi:hypothetical protein
MILNAYDIEESAAFLSKLLGNYVDLLAKFCCVLPKKESFRVALQSKGSKMEGRRKRREVVPLTFGNAPERNILAVTSSDGKDAHLLPNWILVNAEQVLEEAEAAARMQGRKLPNMS